jgi:hypothetical protein
LWAAKNPRRSLFLLDQLPPNLTLTARNAIAAYHRQYREAAYRPSAEKKSRAAEERN